MGEQGGISRSVPGTSSSTPRLFKSRVARYSIALIERSFELAKETLQLVDNNVTNYRSKLTRIMWPKISTCHDALA